MLYNANKSRFQNKQFMLSKPEVRLTGNPEEKMYHFPSLTGLANTKKIR